MIERVPTEIRWHQQEIDRIKQRWFDGEISLAEKRRAIAELNLHYYGDKPATIIKRHLVVVTEEPSVSRETERELVPARTSPLWEDDEDEREEWWKR